MGKKKKLKLHCSGIWDKTWLIPTQHFHPSIRLNKSVEESMLRLKNQATTNKNNKTILHHSWHQKKIFFFFFGLTHWRHCLRTLYLSEILTACITTRSGTLLAIGQKSVWPWKQPEFLFWVLWKKVEGLTYLKPLPTEINSKALWLQIKVFPDE